MKILLTIRFSRFYLGLTTKKKYATVHCRRGYPGYRLTTSVKFTIVSTLSFHSAIRVRRWNATALSVLTVPSYQTLRAGRRRSRGAVTPHVGVVGRLERSGAARVGDFVQRPCRRRARPGVRVRFPSYVRYGRAASPGCLSGCRFRRRRRSCRPRSSPA